MSFKQLWELGEIYTAPLNLFLIVVGMTYAKGAFGVSWSWRLVVYILTVLLFHIATNIFNNYMDYQNASDDHDYKVKSNIIGRDTLSLTLVRNVFILFLVSSSLLGLVLVLTTSWQLLIAGALGYYIGLFYSYGPRPLNSLPIAEIVTALASGFLVPLVAAYVLSVDHGQLTLAMIGRLFLICLPLVAMMFNNLLANNTCDLEEDIVNGRRTFVYYLGKERAVTLLITVFLFSYLWLVGLVWLQVMPWTILLVWLFLPKVWSQLAVYKQKQDKQKTFPLVLKSMSVLMTVYPLLYFGGVLLLKK